MQIDDKFGWHTSDDGMAQKIFKSMTKSYPFIKKYGVVEE